MRKEITETGKTVDAAIETACEKLGCDRENCEWEIIDLPKKTFLGLKTLPAKVKVSVEIPDEKPVPQKVEAPPVQTAPKKPEPKQVPPAQPEKKPEQKHVAAPEKPEQENRPPEPHADAKPEARRDKKAATIEDDDAPRVSVTGDYTEKEKTAVDYIRAILADFGLTANLELFREGGGICIDITGEGLGTIIGRRGETLDAIQYLTGLVANRLEGDYMRVTVDCGDYRMKRKETLEALAKKLASQVLKTNTSKTLEPMNPFERRVIHATVSKIEGVSSSSIGDEPNRRVVITSPTARRPASRGGFSRDGDRRPRPGARSGDRDRGGDRDRRRPPRGPRQQQSPAPQGPPKETPESAAMGDAPIGKLDLE